MLLGLFTLPAYGTVYGLTSTMDGIQSGTGSPGTGSATMNYDDVSGLFSWDISRGGLIGSETIMHFHGPAAPCANAGVQIDFGSISGTSSPSNGSTTIIASQGSELLADLWYINIHTNANPTGEIRGQVNVVPLPAAVWFFGTGLLSLLAARKYKTA